MDTTTIITIITTGAALVGGAATLITQLRGLRAAVAPMTRRAKLRWCILHHASGEADARRLLAATGAAGFSAPARAVIGDDLKLALQPPRNTPIEKFAAGERGDSVTTNTSPRKAKEV